MPRSKTNSTNRINVVESRVTSTIVFCIAQTNNAGTAQRRARPELDNSSTISQPRAERRKKESKSWTIFWHCRRKFHNNLDPQKSARQRVFRQWNTTSQLKLPASRCLFSAEQFYESQSTLDWRRCQNVFLFFSLSVSSFWEAGVNGLNVGREELANSLSWGCLISDEFVRAIKSLYKIHASSSVFVITVSQ